MMYLTNIEQKRIFVKTGDWDERGGLSLEEYYLDGIVDKIKNSSSLEGICILKALLKASSSIPELNENSNTSRSDK